MRRRPRNGYPGYACDIPSHLYSFSFEIKRDCSRPCVPQDEILQYMEGLAKKYDLLPHCRFGSAVTPATWRDPDAHWTLEFESGDTVEGHSFHSARRDWDCDLSSKTVAVIGCAASAVQFVPEVVEQAGQVQPFQRTANWILPKQDDPFSEQVLEPFRNDPQAALAVRQEIFDGVDKGMTFESPELLAESTVVGLAAIERAQDLEVREKLRPQHPYGC